MIEDLRFYTDDGKAHFNVIEVEPPAEEPDDEYPIRLTTGRNVAQYLSGNQTRRLGYLSDQTPAPWVAIHPDTAAAHGIGDRAPVRVTSRWGHTVLPALVVQPVRPDKVFIPSPRGRPLADNHPPKSPFHTS